MIRVDERFAVCFHKCSPLPEPFCRPPFWKVKKLFAKRMGSAWSGTLSEPKRQHVAFCNLVRQRYQGQRNPLRRFLGGREAALHLVISRSHGKQLLQMKNGATANTEPAGFFAEMIRGDRRFAVNV